MDHTKDAHTVIAADLDGTLTESKVLMAPDMAGTLSKWLKTNRFAVISGAAFSQFEKQVLAALQEDAKLENLYLFPINGAACHSFRDGAWTCIYEESLSDAQKADIADAIGKAVAASGISFEELYGEQIGYRGGQVTFSALGQEAPLPPKKAFDPDQEKRKSIVSHLAPLLPDFTITIGGTTSIDITRKGIDKAYALRKMMELLAVGPEQVIFFGDAIFEGGNDFPATTTGATCIKVSGPEETMARMEDLINK